MLVMTCDSLSTSMMPSMATAAWLQLH